MIQGHNPGKWTSGHVSISLFCGTASGTDWVNAPLSKREVTGRSAVWRIAISAALSWFFSSAAISETASYYSSAHHGRKTASGERFNMHAMTAAHRKLPFGTVVKVTNKLNGRSVSVRVNDRGPFVKSRSIDLSQAAARAIGMGGTAQVTLSVGD
jgi:rare lipoprotein A